MEIIGKANYWNEEDPLLRLVWDMGFESAYRDYRTGEEIFYAKTFEVRCDIMELKQLLWSCKYITSVLPDEKLYTWISDGDGSAQRVRNFINNSKLIEYQS